MIHRSFSFPALNGVLLGELNLQVFLELVLGRSYWMGMETEKRSMFILSTPIFLAASYSVNIQQYCQAVQSSLLLLQ